MTDNTGTAHNNPRPTTDTEPSAAPVAASRWDWTGVGEQLFDRTRATREGHGYAAGRAAVEQAIGGLTWHPVGAGEVVSAPFSSGSAIRQLITELRLPRVSAIAWDGALPVRDDHEGPSLYGLYGVQAHYLNGDATVYAVDRGTDCLPMVVHFVPRSTGPTPPSSDDSQPPAAA